MDKEAVLKCEDEDLRSLGLKEKEHDMLASILHTTGGIAEC